MEAIPRRLSFGASRTTFPTEKYIGILEQIDSALSKLHFLHASQSTNAVEAAQIERDVAQTKDEFTNLRYQFISIRTKHNFLDQLKKQIFPSDDEILALKEEVNQAKLKHKDMSEISERYLDSEISLLQDLFQKYDEIQILRTKLRQELEDVKAQISKDSPTDRITLPANILNNDVHEDMFKWYSDITSQLSFLSGIEVKAVHEGEITLKLVNSVLQCEHEMIIRIDSVHKKLMDVQIHPAVHIKDLIEYVRETNPNVGTQIRRLISETQHRIRNTYKKKKEIEEIAKKYQISWTSESNIVTVTVPTGVHATIDLPFEYPSAYPKIRILKLDGVKSEAALQNFVTVFDSTPSMMLTQLMEELNRINA
eukprot:TRINITY_DN13291_c0_g1_i2.p1 TRINITY_DN13291_c0_g1~~TRINITY_DN13291_c0_g1_i2.p1  ORF type:complete len:377 (-),score=105.33 TRINITY_DN13291_c0_g1_i2:39-1139(-)